MRGRFGALRTVLAVAGTLAAALASSAPASAQAAAAAGAGSSPAPVGGARLAGHGVIVSYSPGSVPKLPGIKASAWVVADAGTGQVLAARNPHGWFRPASTLKVLTAISLIPVLNPD